MRNFYVITILSILIFTNCSRISNNEISKYWWKYDSGFHLGDALRFENTDIHGDTLYKNDKPAAIITSCGTGFFDDHHKLIIKEIGTNNSGVYHAKGIK